MPRLSDSSRRQNTAAAIYPRTPTHSITYTRVPVSRYKSPAHSEIERNIIKILFWRVNVRNHYIVYEFRAPISDRFLV